MSDLADFLLARIAEDEAQANLAEAIIVAPNGLIAWDEPGRSRVLQLSPHRLLDECEAKRRIVTETGWVTVMQLLALPYADHPEYRDEWRPAGHGPTDVDEAIEWARLQDAPGDEF